MNQLSQTQLMLIVIPIMIAMVVGWAGTVSSSTQTLEVRVENTETKHDLEVKRSTKIDDDQALKLDKLAEKVIIIKQLESELERNRIEMIRTQDRLRELEQEVAFLMARP